MAVWFRSLLLLKVEDSLDDAVDVALKCHLVVDCLDDLLLRQCIQDHTDDTTSSFLINLHYSRVELFTKELLLSIFITLSLDEFLCYSCWSRLLLYDHLLRLHLNLNWYLNRHSHLGAWNGHHGHLLGWLDLYLLCSTT